MSEALAAIKRELGPDAVILGTRNLPTEGLTGWARRMRVEITAAPPSVPSPAPRARVALPESAARASVAQPALSPRADVPSADVQPALATLPAALYPHYVRLVQNEVASELATQFVQQAAAADPADLPGALRRVLRDFVAARLPRTPGVELTVGTMRRVALVGPSGSGKTTTVAKLAALFCLRQQKRVALLSLDMHRVDAHDQLQHYAELLEIPVHTAQNIAEVKQVTKNLSDIDMLLIDTPGVGPREQARFARVAALLRAARPDETHLVVPASLAAPVLTRMAQAFAPLNATRIVLTRLDDVVGLGVVLNVIQRLALELSYLTTGQNFPHDIHEACDQNAAALLCAGLDE
jgi:flagellar biosynthesis protein FlhF